MAGSFRWQRGPYVRSKLLQYMLSLMQCKSLLQYDPVNAFGTAWQNDFLAPIPSLLHESTSAQTGRLAGLREASVQQRGSTLPALFHSSRKASNCLVVIPPSGRVGHWYPRVWHVCV